MKPNGSPGAAAAVRDGAMSHGNNPPLSRQQKRYDTGCLPGRVPAALAALRLHLCRAPGYGMVTRGRCVTPPTISACDFGSNPDLVGLAHVPGTDKVSCKLRAYRRVVHAMPVPV